jgi:hypothetical protein
MLSVMSLVIFMRDLDPASFQEAQKYYTNQNSDFNNAKVGSRLNNSSDASQNDALVMRNINYSNYRWKRCNYSCSSWNAFDLNMSYFKLK